MSVTSQFIHLVFAIFVILVVTFFSGKLFKYLKQPPVIGEVIGGILLGPSLLGHFLPNAYNLLFPVEIHKNLKLLAQIGVCLYMFYVGAELSWSYLKSKVGQAFTISYAGMVFPMVLGSYFAYENLHLASEGISSIYFALFIGISLSVTALPVLARILTDKNLLDTPSGSLAMACAAISDVTMWCLLSIIVSLAKSNIHDGIVTLILTILFIVTLVLLSRTLLPKLLELVESKKIILSVVILGLLLLSAFATEKIGIHSIFGAFFLGFIWPESKKHLIHETQKRRDEWIIILMPAFFAYTGLRTQLGLMDSIEQWKLFFYIFLIAVIGKGGGTIVGARISQISWRGSFMVGSLMNTRGLVELIVLNIGLELGFISQQLFTILVVMAIVTTLMTGPTIDIVRRNNVG